MLKALELRDHGQPHKAYDLLGLLTGHGTWLTQDEARRDRAFELHNQCALDDMANMSLNYQG